MQETTIGCSKAVKSDLERIKYDDESWNGLLRRLQEVYEREACDD